MKKVILIFIFLMLIANIFLVSAQSTIKIKAHLIDALTGESITGAIVSSGYEFFPSEVISDSNGNIEFSVTDNFKLRDSSEVQKGASYSFYATCYDYKSISLQKDYQDWSDGNSVNYALALRESMFDSKEKVTEVSGKTEIDLGNIALYPMANINIISDIPVSFERYYKNKNSNNYGGGGGSSDFREDNYQTNAFPLNYDVFVYLKDEDHLFYKSPVYHVPFDAKCKTINLEFTTKAFAWSISSILNENNQNYIEIDLKKGWNLAPFAKIEDNGIANDSELKKEDISSQFFHISSANKFFKLYPLKDDDDITRELQSAGIDSNWMQNNIAYLINTGTWIYSKKSGKLKTVTYGEIGSISSHRKIALLSGWNLKIIPISAKNKKIKEISGNCTILKIADWDNARKKWISKDYGDAKEDIIYEDAINKVKAIKVSSNCQFGDTNDISIQPKPYPTKIEGYEIKDSRMEENCNDNTMSDTQQPIGKVCAEVTQLNYEYYNEKYNVNLIKLTQGKDNYLNFYMQTSNATSENYRVFRNSNNRRGIYWLSSKYDLILITYSTIQNEATGKSYNYETLTTFDNPVVKWFLDKYPPI